MGLNITAYSKLTPVGKHYDGAWCEQQYDDETGERIHVAAYAYDDFPQSFRGLPILGRASGVSGASSFFEGGCYAVTPDTKTFGFGAGSYMGYGRWREDLQRQFNPDRLPDGPFYELIWFADNEGTIGPEAAADLLADFRAHADRYEPGQRADWFRQKYTDWTRVFELAADGGLVEFH